MQSVKGLNSTRECFNPDSLETGSKLMVTSRTHDQEVTKEELVLRGSDKSIEDRSALSSHVDPSTSNEQSNKSTSQNCVNPRLPVTSMTSIRGMKTNFVEKNRTSPMKSGRRTPEFPGLKVSRTVGANLEPLNPLVMKDIKRNSEQSVGLHENTGSKRAHSVDTKKQTPPTPTLKRKTFEESSADMLTLTPLKRLSVSPSESRNTRASSDRVVDKQIPKVDIPQEKRMAEIEIYLSIQNDSNVEKAEACSKELEDICNMLKKKHEEAKEILVRAIVNNNNLLMLNHSIYQETIRMVQKFAASLISMELRT